MDIEHWRKEIDEVDGELLRLLNVRARLAIKVGSLKRSARLPLRDIDREQFVLDRLQEANNGPLDQGAVVRLFRRIMRESRRVEALASRQSNDSNLASASNPTKLRGIA
ncbi:MAG TPA: chorismate mutase [Pyrinomonadaceae bacterium]|nr:chorismate mutase [Pyrinomonadaceae bacterium]